MSEPSPSELLVGVADALEQTVLPDLPRGLTRNQIMAAVGIVRRCGDAVDRYGPLLHAGCVDLVTTLRRVSSTDPNLLAASDSQGFDDALLACDALLEAACPAPSELAQVHAELSEQVAALVVCAQRTASPALGDLRQLLERMSEREAELGLSPW